MKEKLMKHGLSYIFCIMLCVAITLTASGCGKQTTVGEQKPATQETAEAQESSPSKDQAVILGEGEKMFYFSSLDDQGEEKKFVIYTDAVYVGEALQELELIGGEEGQYGLYVKTVNGVTLDYDTSGMYWAFYEDGEYAMAGVDTTEITEGAIYSLKAEK